MNFKFFFVIVFFSSFFVSCESSLENDILENPVSLKSASFTYKNVLYTSAYEELNDSVIVFEDKTVNDVYQNILSKPDLATLYEPDGSVVFFDNHDELLQERPQNDLRAVSASIPSMAVNLVEHQLNVPNARYLSYRAQGRGDINGVVLHLPDLRQQNFDDVLTGIDMSTFNLSVYRIELFEHPNYKGKSKSFTCENHLAINDLRHYNMSGILWGKRHWDNEVTSVLVRFIAHFG